MTEPVPSTPDDVDEPPPTVDEVDGLLEGGPDSVEWLREQRATGGDDVIRAGTDLEFVQPEYQPVGTLPSATEWHNLLSIAQVIANSGLAPTVNKRPMTAEAVAVIALKGRELGIPPMMALSHIHIIEGRPTASAELMRALVQRAGHYLAVVEQSPSKATVRARRREWGPDVPTVEVSYTASEAQQAGLTSKGNWRKHPTDMLVARVTSRVCRQLFADALMGASYTPEELGGEVDYTVEGEVLSVAVEPADDQREQEAPEQGKGPPTKAQVQKLAILMRQHGIRHDGEGGDDLYRAAMQAIYSVDSVKDLSRGEASKLIHVLEYGRPSADPAQSAEDVAGRFLHAGADWLGAQADKAAEGSE